MITRRQFLASASAAIFSRFAQGDTPLGKWRFVSEFSDEFNGPSLDTNRWRTDNPNYSGRPPGIIRPQNAIVKDGVLQLITTALPNNQFGTPWFTHLNPVLYGYFEVRVRFSPTTINQSFWFYRWEANATREIDVFEIAPNAPGHEHTIHTNMHLYDGPAEEESDQNRRSYPKPIIAGSLSTEIFHTFGFDWQPDHLRWYFNNRLIREEKNHGFHKPMLLIISSEIHADWFGIPKPSDLPAIYTVDYIRVWRQAIPS